MLFSILLLLYFFSSSDGTSVYTNEEYRTISKSESIVNGEDAEPGEFPYQASLRLKSDNKHHCGGSIITKRHVLTAAHCVTNPAGMSISDYLYVVVGSVYLDKGGQKLDICKSDSHSWFTFAGRGYDIALLSLKNEIKFSESVSQIALPLKDILATDVANVTGWGRINMKREEPNILQKLVDWPLLSNKECQKVMEQFGPFRILSTEICDASHIDFERAICFGDSGSPLAKDDVLYGIASWTLNICGPFPGVYTRVISYINWIKNRLGKDVELLKFA